MQFVSYLRGVEQKGDKHREAEGGKKIRNANSEPPETSVPSAAVLWLQYHPIHLLANLQLNHNSLPEQLLSCKGSLEHSAQCIVSI